MNVPAQTTNPAAGRSGPLIALVFLALIWGYNWVVMKAAMHYVGPMEFAALRVAIGTGVMFALLLVMRVPLQPRHVVKTIFLGLFQTAGFVGLISFAVDGGEAGKSSVLGYTMPFWVIVFGWPFLPDRLRGWQWPAAGLILVGLVLVLELWNSGGGLASSLLALGAGISWAISVIVFKKIPIRDRNELLSVTAWQMVWGMLPLIVAALLIPERPIEWSGYFIGALIYPTSLRANGSGWQLGIGRIGSIVGPLLGALFVGLPVTQLYMWSALPFAVGAVICFTVHRLNVARLAAHPELREAQ